MPLEWLFDESIRLLDSMQTGRLVCVSYLQALTRFVRGRSSGGRAHNWQSSAFRFTNQ